MNAPHPRRRLRLRLAPTGSRRDRVFRQTMKFYSKARQSDLTSFAVRLLPPFLRQRLARWRRERMQPQLAPLQARLNQILDENRDARQMIIFPPSLDWHTQLFQRPQQLALALARQGALVFYLLPGASGQEEPFRLVGERIYLAQAPCEIFWPCVNPIIYLLTWNRKFANAFRQPRVIYDYVDEIEVFEGSYSEMVRDHKKLVSSSALVLATALRLHEEVLPSRPDALLCPNGVEFDRFAPPAEPLPVPGDLEPILEAGRPVIGYYGALALWFDYALVEGAARRRGDLSFLLIGPDYDSTLPPALLDLQNVYWLGVKPYADLPRYLHRFDVATIPFLLNRITHATSPLKLFEYMAAQKPVVITPMQESMRYPGVLVAKDLEEYLSRLDEALRLNDDPAFRSRLRETAHANTWDARARQILEAFAAKGSPLP
jgi:glycosyltransferase involved in cell wall biosynthesis